VKRSNGTLICSRKEGRAELREDVEAVNDRAYCVGGANDGVALVDAAAGEVNEVPPADELGDAIDNRDAGSRASWPARTLTWSDASPDKTEATLISGTGFKSGFLAVIGPASRAAPLPAFVMTALNVCPGGA
jgi:hypothetical protein